MNKFKFFTAIFILFSTVSLMNAQNSNVSMQNANNAMEKAANVLANTSYQPKDEPKSKVRGQVIYEDTGRPVRRGEIVLANAENLVSSYKTITDDNGEFEIEKVEAGTYYAVVEVPGILNPDNYRSFFSSSGDEPKISAPKLARFFQKITVDGISPAQVLVTVKRAGAISGKVIYSDGEPAIGIRVEALRKFNDEFEGGLEELNDRTRNIGVISTADRGYYRFAGLPPGEYIIFVSEKVLHIDYKSYFPSFDKDSELKTYFPDVPTAKAAKVLEISLGQEQTDINITIPDRRLFKISGVVLSKVDGKPMQNATIKFRKKEDDGILNFRLLFSQYRVAATDENGRWMIKDLPKGSYEITVSPPYQSREQYRDDEEKSNKKPKFAEVSKEVKLEDKDILDLKTELPIQAFISGTIIVEGKKQLPKSISILALNEKRNKSFSSDYISPEQTANKTSVDFRIDGLVEDKISLFGYISENEGFYVKSIKHGNTDLMTSLVEIKEGQETKDVKIVLSDEVGTLKGKVQSDDGRFDFPRVFIAPVGMTENQVVNRIKSDVPNENGEFEIKAEPGEYFVYFFQKSSDDKEETWNEWLQRLTKNAEKITIKAGETTKITLKLSK